jgi:hypothetical protein
MTGFERIFNTTFKNNTKKEAYYKIGKMGGI